MTTPKFTQLKPRNAAEQAIWEKNRRTAYYASIRYLLRLLAEGRWEERGYMIVSISAFPDSDTKVLYPYIGRNFHYLEPAKIIQPGKLSFERRLYIEYPIEVFNLKKHNYLTPYRDVQYDHARVTFKRVPLEVTTDGWVYDPAAVLVTGFLANDRVATMLPREYAPEGDAPVSTEEPLAGLRIPLLDTLTTRLRQLPRQQVYLHHDKRYYWSGNPVQFSAYLTDIVSGELYPDDQLLNAELISPAGTLIQRVMLKAEAGRAVGQILLPDTAATGVYRLRAYTNWMRQSPGSYLYDQPLVVYNLQNPGFTAASSPPGGQNAPARQMQVRFYPEGGHLIQGLTCNTGIQVIGPDGAGTAAKGRIIDNQNQEVASFTTNGEGLGLAAFKPAPGRTYKAEIFGADGQTLFALPPARESGFAVQVDNRDSAHINLRVTRTAGLPADSLLLVVQSRRTLVHTAPVTLQNDRAELSVPKAKLPTGVNRLVLFDRKGNLYAERLVYKEGSLPPLQVRVNATHQDFAPREKMQLELTLSDSTGNPVQGDFSVSVTDADGQQEDDATNNSLTSRLLTAELPHFVDAPVQYLAPRDAAERERTDLLMLTQSAGGSAWPDLLKKTPPVPSVEDYFMTVSGKVTDLRGKKALPLCRVIMMPADSSYRSSHQTFSDSTGRFRFPRLDFSDTIRVNFIVFNAQGRTVEALVTLDSIPPPGDLTVPYPSYLLARFREEGEANHRSQVAQYGDLSKVQQLKEVVVKGRKKPKPAPPDIPHSLTSMVADHVLTFNENSPHYTSIFQMLMGVPGLTVGMSSDGLSGAVRIRGFNSFGASGASVIPSGRGSSSGPGTSLEQTGGPASNAGGSSPLFLLDGTPLMGNPYDVLQTINPREVARIEIVTGVGGAAFGANGANGVIAIYLKEFADYDREQQLRARKKYTLTGYITPRPSPQPDYSKEESQKIVNDFRDVLYWNPLLKTDEEGNARVEFYNSDKARRFQVVIQGITSTGQPISVTQRVGQ